MQHNLKIAVYGRPNATTRNSKVVAFLKRLGDVTELYVSSNFNDQIGELKLESVRIFHDVTDFPKVDILVSIGGDGTFLDCVTLVRDSNIPIWGVNVGRLGFLTFTSIDEAENALVNVLDGAYSIESRTMIEVEVDGELKIFPSALNEVTVQKQDSSMITVHAHLDGEFLGTYWSDGVIIATPTGSTAYSLSIGGPIVAPTANVFSISPIAPHNLNMRPLVVPDSSKIELEVESRTGGFLLSLDNSRFELPSGTVLYIRKSVARINFVKFRESNFCINLRSKLLWGVDKRN